jgi:hypothetical protein
MSTETLFRPKASVVKVNSAISAQSLPRLMTSYTEHLEKLFQQYNDKNRLPPYELNMNDLIQGFHYLGTRLEKLLEIASAYLEVGQIEEETRYELELAVFAAETILRRASNVSLYFQTRTI